MIREDSIIDVRDIISIEDLANGEIIKQLNRELEKVLRNVLDKKMELSTARKTTLTIEFKPTADRIANKVIIQASSKLAPEVGHETKLTIGHDEHGIIEAKEILTHKQLEFGHKKSGDEITDSQI